MYHALGSRLLAAMALVWVGLQAGGCKDDPPPVQPPPPPTAPPAPRADAGGGAAGAAAGTPATPASPAATATPMPAAASAQPGAALPEPARRLVGGWKIDVGDNVAYYHFAPDGTFTLTFTGPGGGPAEGKWRVEGKTLVMDNTASRSQLTRAGERESGEIAELSDDRLVMRGKDYHGRDQSFELRRAAPFVAGAKDNALVVGSWRPVTSGPVIVLAEDGTAVVAAGSSRPGQWSQAGKRLTLRVERDLGAVRAAYAPGAPATQGAAAELGLEEVDFDILSVSDATLSLRVVRSGPEADGRSGRPPGGRDVIVFERITGATLDGANAPPGSARAARPATRQGVRPSNPATLPGTRPIAPRAASAEPEPDFKIPQASLAVDPPATRPARR